MANLGEFTLLLALFLSGYAIIVDFLGSSYRDQGLMKSAGNATIAGWLSLSVAIGVLLVALVTNDFTIQYVADHSSINLPLPYKVSALWAGSGGSLLVWLWVQVAIVIWFCAFNGKDNRVFVSRARIFANIVTCLFLVMLLWDRESAGNIDKSLFASMLEGPRDGQGLNPLLQHPAMALHPPTLFIGYAAYIAPFIWALSSLIRPASTDRPPLFFRARNWMLIAWVFLTIGNVLGSWWAYEELGWGGFWAWDPVENSSLMPWLIGTALLHSFKKYKAGTPIGRWVMVLCLLCFSFCIFGTYLTRSGLVASVHAFPDPGLSNLYMVLLAVLWIVALFFAIRQRVQAARTLEPVTLVKGSGVISLTNWLFMSLVVVILLGTLFPAITHIYIKLAEAFSWPKPHGAITLQPEYFTKITAPGGMLILVLIGACPYFFQHGLNVKSKLIQVVLFAAVALVLRFVMGSWALPCILLGVYGLIYLLVDIGARLAGKNKSATRTLSWYGARLAHLGVVFMFLAIAAAEGYGTEEAVILHKNQTADVKGTSYQVTFEGLEETRTKSTINTHATITVTKDGEHFATMSPALAYYASGQQTSEADVRRSLAGDLYLSMTGLDPREEVINLRVLIKPLMNWLWIGGAAMSLGAILVLLSWIGIGKKVQPHAEH